MCLESYIDCFKQLGIWLGRGVPKKGDIVVFDRNENRRLGVVKGLEGTRMIVFEETKGGGEDRWNWSDGRIIGYARVGM